MSLKYKILRFLDDHALVVCSVCYRIFFKKDVEFEVNTLGQLVCLCSNCHKKIFRPFSKE